MDFFHELILIDFSQFLYIHTQVIWVGASHLCSFKHGSCGTSDVVPTPGFQLRCSIFSQGYIKHFNYETEGDQRWLLNIWKIYSIKIHKQSRMKWALRAGGSSRTDGERWRNMKKSLWHLLKETNREIPVGTVYKFHSGFSHHAEAITSAYRQKSTWY